MDFSPEFLSLAMQSGACAHYYAICAEHPMRLGEGFSPAKASEIIKAAKGRMNLSKLAGPGTVLQLNELRQGAMLRFLLQGRCCVETDFSVTFNSSIQRGTLAVLCHAALLQAGAEAHSPPYPRPEFHSMDELFEVFQKLGELAIVLADLGQTSS